MTDDTENRVLERLKQIQAELAAARERDREIISRLGQIESAVAHVGRYQADNYEAIVTDRAAIDKLTERVERIERRLELT